MIYGIRKWANSNDWRWDSVTAVTLSHSFCLQMLGLYQKKTQPSAQVCLYQSLPFPWWVKNKKMVLYQGDLGISLGWQKMPKTRFFNFQLDFWKPSHQLRWVHYTTKKNCKPSSTRIYHNLPSWPTHGRVIALAKCIQCGWTVGMYKKYLFFYQTPFRISCNFIALLNAKPT